MALLAISFFFFDYKAIKTTKFVYIVDKFDKIPIQLSKTTQFQKIKS